MKPRHFTKRIPGIFNIGLLFALSLFSTHIAIAQPANDECSGATPLIVGVTCSSVAGNTEDATTSSLLPEGECGSAIANDVWFTVTPTTGTTLIDILFESVSGSEDVVAQVYSSSDNTCGGTFSVIGCNDDGGSDAMPALYSVPVTAGQTYYVRVWSYSEESIDEFSVCAQVSTPPANDECINAIVLSGAGSVTPSDNISSTESLPPTPGCNSIDAVTSSDVWFSVTADFDGDIDIEVDESSFDAVTEVFSGTCDALTSIACEDYSTFSFSAIEGETYYIRVDGWEAQQGEFSILIGGDALPVTMNELKGKVADNKAQLSWNTFSEQNNRGFEIQRSFDGKQFNKVGFVASHAANGNSSQNLAYNFTDATPISGAVYYRLQQVDIDGKTALSNVVRLSATDNSSGLSIIATPNPVANNLKVSIIGNRAENGVIQIADITGKLVKSIAVNTTDIAVDMIDMAAGVYFVRYNDNLQSQVIKVVKQ